MKLGVILVGYGMEDFVEPCLRSWILARWEAPLWGHEIKICAVSVPFAGFPNDSEDNTIPLLNKAYDKFEIDNVITGPKNITEKVARGMGLMWLEEKGCDTIIQVDLDEVYTLEDIRNIFKFTEDNPFIAWFRISFKNLVFTPEQYLAEVFCPPRIHRVKVNGYKVHSFSADNDILYGGTITRDLIPQDRFPSLTIPKEVAFVRHFSWLNNSRSKKKVEYQKNRWGDNCSFAWDDTQGGLIFNPALPVPKVLRET